MYHTAVIGGGCLGAAAAISIQRRLKNSGEKVCLIEKAVLCAAESSRHSGIIRSANADPDIAIEIAIKIVLNSFIFFLSIGCSLTKKCFTLIKKRAFCPFF